LRDTELNAPTNLLVSLLQKKSSMSRFSSDIVKTEVVKIDSSDVHVLPSCFLRC
jgi:hypothetical protein